MDYELIFVLWFVLMVVTGVIQIAKGMRLNSNKHFYRGLLSLGVCLVLVYIAWQFVRSFKKIGG